MRIIKVEIDRAEVQTVVAVFCNPGGSVNSVTSYGEDGELYEHSADEHELRLFFSSAPNE